MQLTTLTSKGQVTIPLNIRDYLGLSSGDKVLFEEVEGVILVKPAPSFFDFRGSLKDEEVYSSKKVKELVSKNLAKRYTKYLKS